MKPSLIFAESRNPDDFFREAVSHILPNLVSICFNIDPASRHSSKRANPAPGKNTAKGGPS